MVKTKILFTSYPDYSGNCRALSDYILNNKFEFHEIFWVVKEPEKYHNDKINFINMNQAQNMKNEFIAIFDTHGILLNIDFENGIYVNLWHGNGPKRIGNLISNENLTEYDKQFISDIGTKVDYAFVSSEFLKVLYQARFNYTFDRIIITGTPRTDELSLKDISTMQKLGINKNNKKVILYMPTYRRINEAVQELQNFFNVEKLKNFLNKNNFIMIIKKHPHDFTENYLTDDNNRIYFVDDEFLLQNNCTVNELLVDADLLITDYSSVYVDYIYLNKPVLFEHSDFEHYNKHRGIQFDNIELWFPGPIVKTEDECYIEILKLLNDKQYYQNQRKNFINLMYKYNDFNNSARVYNFMFDKTGTLNENISKYESIKHVKHKFINIKKENEELIKKIEIIENENKALKERIQRIENSKLYKIYKKICCIKPKNIRRKL